MAMLSSSCSALLLSCTKERRLSSSGRFPEAARNRGLLREPEVQSTGGQTPHPSIKDR